MKGAPFHPPIISIRLGVNTDRLTGYADNGGPPSATQSQPTEQSAQTESMAPNQNQQTGESVQAEQVGPNRVRTEPTTRNPAQSGYQGMSSAAKSFPILPGGAIVGGRSLRLLNDGASLTSHHLMAEPRRGTPSLASSEVEVHGATVREPPAWKLNYEIGHGACGTVFLEKVKTRGMSCAELWAVKRIPKAVPNFDVRRYREEVRNLQELSNVSFAQISLVSQRALVSFGLWEVLTCRQYEWFVKFNTSYEDDNFVYIAMEYFPLGDMSKTFVQSYRWNESDTKVVFEQLLRGLAVMHEAGITHRDLKPEVCALPRPKYISQSLIVTRTYSSTSQRMGLTPSV